MSTSFFYPLYNSPEIQPVKPRVVMLQNEPSEGPQGQFILDYLHQMDNPPPNLVDRQQT